MQSRRSKAYIDAPLAITVDEDVASSPKTSKKNHWYTHPAIKWALNVCSFLSLVSVCLNTPDTFKKLANFELIYLTFALDLCVLIVFTVEMIIKILRNGLIKPIIKTKNPYLRDHWCRFEFAMVLCIYISVILHVVQIYKLCTENLYYDEAWMGILRSPRPLVVVRIFRNALSGKLPTARISQILKRSSQQIYNVCLFFLFFMSFYGILGVQLFGALKYHCVRKGANVSALMIDDLAIPDAVCTPHNDANVGYVCPDNMTCVAINENYSIAGFSTFEHFPISFFSVYNSASQEGWTGVMYDAIDTLASWKAYVYFLSLIFFLSWLVKNVFIAVIIETFAEIRVQFQQMWGSHDSTSQQSSMILANEENNWKLVSLNERKPFGLAPALLQNLVKSPYFNTAFMFIVLADALTAACRISRRERQSQEPELDELYYAQVFFTIVFNLEVLLKLWVYGPRGYIRPSRHKFEAAVAIFSTFNIIPRCYRGWLTYAQVLRIFRLIKASPILEEFCWKIFGPGKKLGSLILFTMALQIIISGISLQLFCYIKDEKTQKYHEQFSDFLKAYQYVFQILTNENWSSEMDSLMKSRPSDTKGQFYAALVACYFVVIHLSMTAIILSLFVAVILDNLDLDEDIKRLKQLKAREISTAQQQNLPLRLRVFERFPNKPQLVNVAKRITTEFDAPKVRESFMRTFVDSGLRDNNNSVRQRKCVLTVPQKELSDIALLTGQPAAKSLMDHPKRTEIANLISESNEQRMMNSSDPILPKGSATMPTAKSLLSSGQGANTTLRSGKARTNVNARNPRMLSMDAGKSNTKWNGVSNQGQLSVSSASNPKNNAGDDIDIQILQQKKQQAEIKRSQQESDLRENHPLFDTPLFIVGRESRFREVCKTVVTARYPRVSLDPVTGKENKTKYSKLVRFLNIVPVLDWFMILITLLSCLCMMLETPFNRVTDPKNPAIYLVAAEYIFVASMSMEMALKIIANGLFFTPNALIRDVGGALDMFIYFTSLLFLVVMVIINPESRGTIGYLSYGHILLIVRCMRPLRIFILVPHIRKVVYELVRGFKEILLVSVLLLMLMFVFASYGVQCFGGKLYRCNDPSIGNNKTACKGMFFREVKVTDMDLTKSSKPVGYMVPRVWTNPPNFNFDNMLSAMLALFEVLSLEGWVEVRDILIDRVGPHESFYVHVFVFIGSLIGVTLFVGVVVSNYSQNKGTALLTVDQRRWLDLKGRINLTQPLHVPPRPEKSPVREFMFDITQHRFFKRTVAVIVALNLLLLVVPWHTNIPLKEQMPPYTKYLQGVAVFFCVIFLIEVTMKLVALSPKGYWYSRRNRMDLFVTSAGILWIILHFSLPSANQSNDANTFNKNNREFVDTLGYIVVILRFFTITGKHATLKMLMLTIVESMWKSFFLTTGMFLMMLFYAYAGVLMFGTVKYGEALNRHANFRTAGQAIILLFRMITGEDWHKIMHDCMISPPNCFKGNNYWQTDCGNKVLSVLYFCTFYVIITYIMLNLLVAIIQENFSLFYSNEEDALLSYNDIRMYQNTWNAIDLERRGAIPNRRVPFLLRLLKGRLEIDRESLPTRMLFRHMCYEIEYLHGGPSGEATFHDVLIMLSYRSVDIRKSLQLEELLGREDLEVTVAEEVAKAIISQWLTCCIKRMRARGHVNLAKRAVQEPYYVVTEAEETPLVEAVYMDSSPEFLTNVEANSSMKHKITRNISEPLSGLQIPKKLSNTVSDPQGKDRQKKTSPTPRSKFSPVVSENVVKEKAQNVDDWWNEQMKM